MREPKDLAGKEGVDYWLMQLAIEHIGGMIPKNDDEARNKEILIARCKSEADAILSKEP